MAYNFNWDKSGKMTDQQIIEHIRSIAPDYTDNKFYVAFASDDGGRHVVLYAEVPDLKNPNWKPGFERADHGGWRVIRCSVPVGHIDTFLNKGKDEWWKK